MAYLCRMITDNAIREPFLFNPLKHHLGFIREFINLNIDKNSSDLQDLTKDLKHLGTSVMDIYTGSLTIRKILNETEVFLKQKDILSKRDLFCLGRFKYEMFQNNIPVRRFSMDFEISSQPAEICSCFPRPQQSAYLPGKIQYAEISAGLHYNNR